MIRALAVLALVALAACGGPAEPRWAPDAAVAEAHYTHPGPPTLTLFTVVAKGTGSGAHSGLMISGSERVMFDPAGTFKLPFAPERNDVHYGMTPRALDVYIDYHARETYDVVRQEVVVTPEQAAIAMRLAQSYGAVPKAQCSLSITRILSQVPGFESIPVSYFPVATMKRFGALPGVTTTRTEQPRQRPAPALRW